MNRKKFLKSLQALSGWRETAFLLALAERALPNLLLYLESAGMAKDLPNYQALMSQTWRNLIREPEEDLIGELLDHVTDPVGVLEQDENYGASPSLSCLTLWEQALLSELNRERSRAQEASQISMQSVMDFIEFSEGDGLSENSLVKLFDRHDLMTREFSFQEELADMLRAAKHASPDVVSEIRELAQDDGVSNLGISLSD